MNLRAELPTPVATVMSLLIWRLFCSYSRVPFPIITKSDTELLSLHAVQVYNASNRKKKKSSPFCGSIQLSLYFAFLRALITIHSCPLECLLITACGRTSSLVNAPICTLVFTAVSYKRRSRCVRDCF